MKEKNNALENQLFSWENWDQMDTACFYFYDIVLVRDVDPFKKGEKFSGANFDIEKSKLTLQQFNENNDLITEYEFDLSIEAIKPPDKILFLDIDGVLVPRSYNYAELMEKDENGMYILSQKNIDNIFGANKEYVDRLNSIVDATKCKIVLSSDWRFRLYDKVISSLAVNHRIYGFIGKTPVKMSNYVRWNEIKWWLEGIYKVFNGRYCVIDDDESACEDKNHFVYVNKGVGMCDSDVNKAIYILNNGLVVKF